MPAIQANQVHQAAQVQWVILVHQVLHFQVNEVKRVFQVQLVIPVHTVLQVQKESQVGQVLVV
jgi:hypothetical protein